MLRVIWNGDEGEVWTNDTDRHAYQFLANWHNTCGVCAQYDHAISPTRWPIPIHNHCNCRQEVVKAGAKAKPWVNYREIAAELPEDQQVALVGRSNWKLIQSGMVKWEDVVTPYRLRSLREVVAIRDLDVKQLTGAGVTRRVAENAHAAVNTPAHQLVAQQRQQLLQNLTGAGMSPAQVRELAASGLGKRVVIGAGPGGASFLPTIGGPKTGPSLDSLFRAVLTGWTPAHTKAAMGQAIRGDGIERKPLSPKVEMLTVERDLGVRFEPAEIARDNPEFTTVVVDVAKIDASLRRDPESHVGPGGTGAAIGGRYEEFERFLAKAKAGKTPIQQPQGGLTEDGEFTLIDGRHRFAVFRDQGAEAIPVSVRKSDAAKIRKRYGWKPEP